MTTQIVSPIGQFSYPNLFKPKGNNLNKDDKRMFYSVDILFNKDTDLTDLKKAADEAIAKKLGSDKSKYPKKIKLPFKDGDEKGTPEYQGKIYITCRTDASRGRMEVFDRKTQKLLEHESDVVGGDFGRVLLNFYYYDANGNKGVSAGLSGVLLTEKTTSPFSGSVSPWQAFESLAEDSYKDEEQNADMFK